ncbi:MAG: TIGR03617 family F420-dependent LLM class oxidoreductase [Acidimicrobiia bacterium]
MKADYFLPPMSLTKVASETRRIEQLGFDGLFTADTTHDPFLPLVTAAASSERIDLGTGIAVAFARSPMTVAQTTWDLADASGGRFILGLGPQIRAHITRRFSMPWVAPAARMREYLEAIRAIWDTWQNGVPLRFKGEHYSFTLMTPFFNPGPIKHPDVPIYISAVNPLMSRLAGELCQGIHVHPFHTPRYLTEVIAPEVARGAAEADREPEEIALAAAVFVVSGKTSADREASEWFVRQQIAFYASTPAYRRVLDLHGWDFGEKLTAMSKRGEWAQMAGVISDDVLHEVAVVVPLGEVGAAIAERYEGVLSRVAIYENPGLASLSDEDWSELAVGIKAG